MTNEQWLVYIYSIYPEGGFQAFYIITAFISFCITLALRSNYHSYMEANYHPVINARFTPETKAEYLSTLGYSKLGKLKFILPSTLLFLALLCNFVPNKNAFIYIIATPYLVDGAKSTIDLLQDPTSKVYKINQLLDKGLDKALMELDKPKDNNANQPK